MSKYWHARYFWPTTWPNINIFQRDQVYSISASKDFWQNFSNTIANFKKLFKIFGPSSNIRLHFYPRKFKISCVTTVKIIVRNMSHGRSYNYKLTCNMLFLNIANESKIWSILCIIIWGFRPYNPHCYCQTRSGFSSWHMCSCQCNALST